MKSLFKALFFLILVFQFISCNNSKPEIKTTKISHKDIVKESKNEVAVVETEDYSFPVDSILKIPILNLGVFHRGEVDPDLEKKTWFGLFKNHDNYTFLKTNIAIKSAYDPVLDEDESEHTGWEVSVAEKDTCVILIEKYPYFIDKKVEAVKLPEKIYPQGNFEFQFLGVQYILSATGKKKKESEDSDAFVLSDYKLYLTANSNGKATKTLLVEKKNFDDQIIKIIFAGDIDGDSKLDLIIDTAAHYNVSSPTLYLSKEAGKEEVVRPVGVFTTVGC
ncbi:hypothetical protein [Flavobacterium hungaricum]|uniref:Lipoprotein n=1 Tax=Flavobacterium hungaricum TaxID=2082725 RepID=A0ABR9TRI0_9FLAO|nr:hypothetical protein [Flavobacterium hungaricum]MBE8727881.1 hypothetical protein [Flavobacterium hungaricum]